LSGFKVPETGFKVPETGFKVPETGFKVPEMNCMHRCQSVLPSGRYSVTKIQRETQTVFDKEN
jgi:hypothetical protein